MARYLLLRIVQAAAVVFLISLTTFFLLFVVGNPVHLLVGESATSDEIRQLTHRLGLDQPLLLQYARFAAGMLRGDFGQSLFMRGEPALQAVLERVPATLELAGACLGTTLLLATPMGIAAGVWRNTPADYAVSLVTATVQGIPSFWLGIALIMLFSVRLHWLPFAGGGTWKHLVMPAATLTLYLLPTFVRLFRSRFIDVLQEEYVRTARAKGVPPRSIYGRHVLRNTLGPLIAALGLQAGHFFSGVVVVETIFGWPGAASLIVTSVAQFDYPVVQAGVVVVAVLIAASNLAADIAVAFADPRLRYEAGR